MKQNTGGVIACCNWVTVFCEHVWVHAHPSAVTIPFNMLIAQSTTQNVAGAEG